VCGHSFSAIAIREYLKGRTSKKCPGAGCNKSFTIANIKPDKDLAKRVKLADRRAQRQKENTDADEVVE
jgi:SUMO ligase MMS21 Smc5/6 complex component